MTVQQLKVLLANCPDEWEVVLSRDSEGNGYSPLSGIGEGHYAPDTTWCGEFLSHPEDNPPPFNAIALWPTN